MRLLWALAPAQASALGTKSIGHLELLTYNVAGLPEGLSPSHPSVNLPLVGKLINRYDIVLVQEDLSYAALLRRSATHPFASTTPDHALVVGRSSAVRFDTANVERLTQARSFATGGKPSALGTPKPAIAAH